VPACLSTSDAVMLLAMRATAGSDEPSQLYHTDLLLR